MGKQTVSNIEAKSELWSKALAQRRLRFDHLLQRGTAEPGDDGSLSSRVVRLGLRRDGRKATAFQPVEQRLSEFANRLSDQSGNRTCPAPRNTIRSHRVAHFRVRGKSPTGSNAFDQPQGSVPDQSHGTEINADWTGEARWRAMQGLWKNNS